MKWQFFMNTELFIARRYLYSKKRRFFSLSTSVAIGGIFVGVSALLITLSMMNGFQNELRRRILGGTPHIIVGKYFNEPLDNSQEIMDKLQNEDYIKGMAPFVYQKSIVRFRRQMDGVLLKGVDPELERSITEISGKIVDGVFELENSCVLGIELAHNLQIDTGDTLIIAYPFGDQFGVLPRIKKVILKGIFDFGYYEYNSILVIMHIKDVQALFDMKGMVSGIEIKVDDVYKTPGYSKKIEEKLAYPYRAKDWIDNNRNVFAALRLEKIVTFIVLALIILVGGFNIVGTLANLVKKKTKEIGILRSFGISRFGIMKIFIYHGLIIGIAGTIMGLIFSFLACSLLSRYEFINLPGDVYFIETLPVEMETGDFLITASAAIAITFLATLYPAIRATYLTPVEALRNE